MIEGRNASVVVVVVSQHGCLLQTSPTPTDLSPAPPSTRRAEDERLLRAYLIDGDLRARDELVMRFLPLARQLARRYKRGSEPIDDLVQVASLGLVKAIDRYDLARGNAFSSYAVPTILGELKRYFRDQGWAVHVPRGMQERILKVTQAMESLSRTLGRSPTPGELAAEIGLPTEDVLEALDASLAYEAASLDAPRSLDADADSYAESVGAVDEGYEQVEYLQTIAPTMRAMPARDRLVLKLRFEDDLTQAEIAELIGVSQMHVSRLIRRAVARLRTVADAA
jgi:RNA polymerase sigma-B factor